MWPIDLALPEPGEHYTHHVHGEDLSVARHSPTHLDVTYGTHTQLRVGIDKSATTLRFIPHPGAQPLLNFLEPRLLCPARSHIDVVITVELHTRMGVGRDEQFVHLIDMGLRQQPKALYGPVDAGIICRSIHTPHYASLEQCRHEHDFGEETSDSLDTAHPVLTHAPMAMVHVSLSNVTTLPLEVSKIMVPLELIGLYQHQDHLYMGRLTMKLVGPHEAELDYAGPPDIKGVEPLRSLDNSAMIPAKKTFLFVHNYRTKTGLDFGF